MAGSIVLDPLSCFHNSQSQLPLNISQSTNCLISPTLSPFSNSPRVLWRTCPIYSPMALSAMVLGCEWFTAILFLSAYDSKESITTSSYNISSVLCGPSRKTQNRSLQKGIQESSKQVTIRVHTIPALNTRQCKLSLYHSHSTIHTV